MSLKKLLFSSIVVFIALTVHVRAQNLNGIAVPHRLLSPHMAEAWKHLAAIGQPAATNELHLAIGLPLRHAGELTALLAQLYDPGSTNYHRYLTPAEFAGRFGATEADYQSVAAFAATNGLRVTATHPNRLVLDVAGSVADVEKTFHVTLHTYRHPGGARDFFAPDTEPSLDLDTPVLQVSGLNNYSTRRPHFHRETNSIDAHAVPHAGTGPSSTYLAKDLRSTYLPGVTNLTGKGQSVGLLQFDTYYAADINSYISTAGITTSTTLTNVAVDGGVSTPGDGNGEVALDIQMVLALAPGVSKIYVYEAPNPSPWVDLLSRMANDNTAKQLSCSWGDDTPSTPDTASEQIFLQMATQGQSFFNATGDSDAFTNGVPFPSESTNVTQVGATTLTTATTGGVVTFTSESVWNWDITRSATTYDGVGSSGGISLNFSIPPWQQGMTNNLTNAAGSLTKRNSPDVAFTGDNVYSVSDNGSSAGATAGTSCAAPLWAGFMALVNQQGASNGLASAGFINPAVYAIGKGANYNNCFHDVTAGNNEWTKSTTKYKAVTGYDLCTGWGTPNGGNLINALAPLASTPPTITAAPQSQTNSFGATAVFTVAVNGSLPLAYQWYFTNAISGATNSSLVLSNLTAANAGNYFVVVTNSFGSVTSSLAALTVTLAPGIASFSPAYGVTNDTIIITGFLFTNVTAVKFNGVSAVFVTNSVTQITATVPIGASTGPLSVTTAGGSATSLNSFTVLAGNGVPVVASFSPASAAINASVILTGTNFAGVTGVSFNGVSAVYNADSLSQITATVPVGATDGLISVTNGYGVGVSATSFTIAADPGSSVSISQVYGGGGSTGAPYQNDYIELYNRSASAVDLSAWSVQYASATGTSWQKANLTGSIQPGHYYLIAGAAGTAGSALPTPDASATGINISASKGKIALVSSQTAITSGTSSPIGTSTLVDFVGYGAADSYEGTGPAPAISVTNADFRAGAGATDTGNNDTDFTAGTPTPRNSSTGNAATTDLAIHLTHVGNFTQGDAGDTYTITVTNVGFLASSGSVSLVDTLPAGLIATAISGTGWTAILGTLTCTRNDVLAAAAGYPPITLTVSVATNAAALVSNSATVSGGGDANAANNTATDSTTINTGGVIVGTASYGGVLAGWEVNLLTGYGASPLAATTNAPGITLVGLTRGNGVGTASTAAQNAWGGSGFVFTTEAAAITGNSFATFSLVAGSGYTMSCTNIPAYNVRRSNTGATTGIWQYQVGSGAFTDIGTAITWGTTTSSAGNAEAAINLSGISTLQNVAAGTSVTFRVVLWGGTGTGSWYINNLSTSGLDLQVLGSLASVVTTTPPVITVSPSPTNVFAGNNTSFAITATGTAPLAYQWRKNGAAIADGGAISGTGTNILNFAPAATNHTGSYSVVVTNAGGSVTSTVAALNVLPVPGLIFSNSASGPVLLATGGAVSNRYVVQVTTNLTAPLTWLPLQTNVIGADGLIRFTNTGSTAPLQFYRVLFP